MIVKPQGPPIRPLTSQSAGVHPIFGDSFVRILKEYQRRILASCAVPAELLGDRDTNMNVLKNVQDVRRKMLGGDKQQTFVSGDVQPGRPVEVTDVKGPDDESDPPGPTVDPTTRR